ncbi:MAG TPA: hypothetical protein DCY17_01710 [Clostridiales bacterium]|nr:hypothetical protein [Clostridiales bacterium]
MTMAKNESTRNETTAKATENTKQSSGESGWNRIIRIKADKSAVVKPAVACGVTVGAFAVAIIVALIVLL